jgi:dethiobiotin synthetase
MKGIFITGTNTEVGKTTIAIAIIKKLQQQGINVKVRKPVETDCNPDPKDAMKLAQLTGEDIKLVCPFQYQQASSPEKADRTLLLKDLTAACKKGIEEDDFLIVEGAGGFYSPIAKNTVNADLARVLDLKTVLVVKDELGCLSQALLTIEAIENRHIQLHAVVLNTFVENDLNNYASLKRFAKRCPILRSIEDINLSNI